MSTSEVSPSADHSESTDTANTRESVLAEVADICRDQLRPLVREIDEQGVYPEGVMRNFGAAGLYSQHVSADKPASAIDMSLAIESMALVGYECLSTAFCVWCHDAAGWYLEKSNNSTLRDAVLPSIASGESLGATGLSNPMKFYSGIETLRLHAQRVDGGYVVNGSLPWVSNLGDDHYFGVVFDEATNPDHKVMALIRCDRDGVKLCDGGRFIALEGSRTYAVRLTDCFIDDGCILADPADDYVRTIRPGFVLMQVGMGVGLIRSCIDQMKKQDKTHHHVNQFLPDGPDELQARLDELLTTTKRLAETPHETSPEFIRGTLQARLDAGELCLTAANACMLSGGARAYMEHSLPFRKLREAYFVGVVTPATKHLRKEISRINSMMKASI